MQFDSKLEPLSCGLMHRSALLTVRTEATWVFCLLWDIKTIEDFNHLCSCIKMKPKSTPRALILTLQCKQ